jgi:hypothetical protein
VNRRDPPAPPPGDATALIERPSFGDDSDERPVGAAGKGVVDSRSGRVVRAGRGASPFDPPSEEQRPVDETGFDEDTDLTDSGIANRPSLRGAPTQRIVVGELGSLDDLDELPMARVSELDVSDLDGDVEAAGAPTAIMQLPPEMLAHRAEADADDGRGDPVDGGAAADQLEGDTQGADDVDALGRDIAFRRWTAGPQPPPDTDVGANRSAEVTIPPPPPSLAASTAAPPRGGDSPASRRERLVAWVDETTAAITAAQTVLDELDVPTDAAQTQLLRALGILARVREGLG